MSDQAPTLSFRSSESVTMSLLLVMSCGLLAVVLCLTVNQSALAFVCVVPILVFGWRATRICLRLEPNGVRVRNTLRSHNFAWTEVADIVDSRVRGPQGAGRWGLAVRSLQGQAVTSIATGGLTPPDGVLRAVKAYAADHGVRVSAEGVVPSRLRPSRKSELAVGANAVKVGQESGVSFQRVSGRRKGYSPDEVDDFLTHINSRSPEHVRTVQFGTTRGGYDMDEVDQFLKNWE